MFKKYLEHFSGSKVPSSNEKGGDKPTLSNDYIPKENRKNPICALNELRLNANYKLIKTTGPSHDPLFKTRVEIQGLSFDGIGGSKKISKYEAAKAALKHIMGSPKESTVKANMHVIGPSQESTLKANSRILLSRIRSNKNFHTSDENDEVQPNEHCLIDTYKSGFENGDVSDESNGHNTMTGLKYVMGPQKESTVNKHDMELPKENTLKASSRILLSRIRSNKYVHNSSENDVQPDKQCLTDSSKSHFEDGDISDESNVDSQQNFKKFKSEIRNINIEEKNPISILNELRYGLKYEIMEQLGPPHNPTFKVRVNVDGQTYYGVGNSKKAAKCEAANEALKSFIQFPNSHMILSANKNTISVNRMDFTSDQIPNKDKALQKLPKNKVAKGPLMMLNEMYPDAEFTCTNNESDPYARFKVILKVGNETFQGTGSNKRLAKNAAAATALNKLRNYHFSEDSTPVNQQVVSSEEQEKADLIGRLVNEKFSELMVNDLTHIKRKVLAGIVMYKGSLADAEVICVTTGTKCVSGEHISINGASLNDMHAEILSRRCLIKYFYDQLDLLVTPDAAKSIFGSTKDSKGYKLKDGIEFHLYINTAPCGDARIFSPHEENTYVDKHPNRISRGQLRTKIESGEGTIPVKTNSLIQTWDGIIQGERLLTMSCSDKICRWNVLGLQGALLTHFVEPIYLKSIVLGSLLKETHLYRAICGRIEDTLQGLPPPFLLNRPSMYKITSVEVRQPQKAPNFSVLWVAGLEQPEIVNTTLGKPEEGMSVVAKQNLAGRFVKLFQSLPSKCGKKEQFVTYMDAKEKAFQYNVAKKSLNDAFKKAQLGAWVSKPIEQDMFDI